jgi:hypothetical protein
MILSGVRGPTPRALSWLFLAVTLVLFGCGLYLAPRALRQSGPLRRRNAILTLVIYAIGTCIGVVGALVLLLGESR